MQKSTNPDFEDLLNRTPPFASFPAVQRREVASLAIRREYRRDEFVTLRGERWPYLALVEGGAFEAVKESPEGRVLSVLTVRRGEIFWGLTFFDLQAPMPAAFRAATPGRLALWSREDLLPWLKNEGEALWALCGLLVARMQQASEVLEDLAFQPVAGRLAKLLLHHYAEADTVPMVRDLTLDEMASLLGTTREMVCRLLYRFSDDELIHITRTEFNLLDRHNLARIAGHVKDAAPPAAP